MNIMMRRRILMAIVALIVALPFFSTANAKAPMQEMEIILDASGSMWAQIGGKAKIAIAKEVLVDVVEGLKGRDDLMLGVRVYGHQSDKSKKNCKDTKLELGFAAPSVEKTRALTKRITAKGQTPIAYSLAQAKGDFDLKSKGAKTIILITDGLESCDGDPCALAKELAGAGFDIKMHVVGFDLDPKAMAKLKCLVEPSGGMLLAAKDASQLTGALDKIIRKTLSENLVIHSFDSKRKPVGVFATAYKAGTREKVGTAAGEDAKFSLPAGTYDIDVKANSTSQVVKLKGVAVKEDAKTEKDVVFGIGMIGAIAKGNGGLPVKAYVRVFEVSGDEEKFINGGHSTEKAKLMPVVPGTYRLKIEHDKTKENRVVDGVAVADGQKVIKEVSFAQARIGVVGKDALGNPIDVLVDVKRKEGDEYKFVTSSHTDGKVRYFDVKPGTYLIKARNNKTGQEVLFEDVVVKEGQEVLKEASFAQAKVGGMGRNASGDPIRVNVRIDRKKRDEYEYVTSGSAYEEPRIFNVLPGTYKVTITNNKTSEKKVIEDVVVGEGGNVIKEASFAQAKVGGMGRNGSGDPIRVNVRIDRKKRDEYEYVTSGSAYEEPRIFNVVPGTYRLVITNSKTDQRKVLDDVIVAEGQKVLKEVSFAQAKIGGMGRNASGDPVEVDIELRQKKGDEYEYLTSANTDDDLYIFNVVPGTYRLIITDTKSDVKKEYDDITLSDGQKVIKEAQF